MGKVKKLRQKYHLSLKKSKSLNNLPESVNNSTADLNLKKNSCKSNENIFAGISISVDELTKCLPNDFDARSVISTKSRKELKEEERHLKKKDRQKLRRERFLNQLELSYQVLQNSKSKNKKSKKLCDNKSSLLEALKESSSTLFIDSEKKKKEKTKLKTRGIMKSKHRLKQQKLDSKIFKKVLDNKNFKDNPFETISEYLKQKISYEAQ